MNDTSPNAPADRLKAITRELANQGRPKGERIDLALRRLRLLAEDLDAGMEEA